MSETPRRRSLASRLLTFIIGWLVIALIATAVLVAALVRTNAERELHSVLLAHAYGIMGAVEVNADGSLSAEPQIGDPRFSLPSSGWYWAITTANEPTIPLVNSASIAGDVLALPIDGTVPFDARFQRIVQTRISGEAEDRLEAQVYLGDSETLYQVVVAGNRATVGQAVQNVVGTLLVAFVGLVLGTALVTYFAVQKGLEPLADARTALAAVRSGAEPDMPEAVPSEIEPLVEEINNLAHDNRATLERARHQVGNLAHALKTPLAAAMNEADRIDSAAGTTIKRQLVAMRSTMAAYLDRARRGARRESARATVQVDEIVAGVFRVVRKLNPQITFSYQVSRLRLRCESEDVSEILGTVVENASRHCRTTVRVSANRSKSRADFVLLSVEDDGPGLNEAERALVLRRGERLDERSEGSGLGLSIVSEIAADYGGWLELDPATLGGLKVSVYLPASPSASAS